MKKVYISDIHADMYPGKQFEILGWLKNKRVHGKLIFLDVVDSSGELRVVANRTELKEEIWNTISDVKPESAICLTARKTTNDNNDIVLIDLEIIGVAEYNITPQPRSDFDYFNSSYTNTLLDKRHLYIKNPTLMRILRLKHFLRKAFREFLDSRGFIEIDMPIISETTLYGAKTAFSIDYFGVEAHLSQCAGLYLGAAVQAFERVYTIAPSLRSESSKSPRHNPEFWHVKAQLAFSDRSDMMDFVSEMIYESYKLFESYGKKELSELGIERNIVSLRPPYPAITYSDAVDILHRHSIDFNWGDSLNQREEQLISSLYEKPVFVTDLPAASEPFPYQRDPADTRKTRTADLLASEGFGEVLGIAEVSREVSAIEAALNEKNIHNVDKLNWYFELRKQGYAPNSAFGLGLERMLRWFLRLPHVRDTFAFPRLYNRRPYP